MAEATQPTVSTQPAVPFRNLDKHQTSIDVTVEVLEVTKDASTQDYVTGKSIIVLNNVSDIPDLLAAEESIDVTAMGNAEHKYIKGLRDNGELEFTLWYDEASFDKLHALPRKQEVAVQIRFRDGSGVDVFGYLSMSIAGFGVGDAVSCTMTILANKVERRDAKNVIVRNADEKTGALNK